MAVIGIDNGVTGTIGFICADSYGFTEVPVVKCLDYTTSKKKEISRLEVQRFLALLTHYKELAKKNKEPLIIYMERPLVNPAMFNASLSAVRCLEAELGVIESLQLPYTIIDSKAWQRLLLPAMPSSTERKEKKGALKMASMEVAIKLFPKVAEKIKRHKDGDGLLIARYGRLKEGEK